MNRALFLLVILWVFSLEIMGQSTPFIEGVITYLSNTNVYVKFSNTNDILVEDTLYAKANMTPILVVQTKSSVSVVGKNISTSLLKIGDIIVTKPKTIDKLTISVPIDKPNDVVVSDSIKNAEEKSTTESQDNTVRKYSYTGRFTASTNASISDREDFQRIRLVFAMNVKNIKQSKFSFQNYITFRHRYGIDQSTVGFYDDFKIYSLVGQYEMKKDHIISFGRYVNNKLANIGAIDGLQYDGRRQSLLFGAFLGSRPDFNDYSFNPNLLQGGAYVGVEKNVGKGSIQASAALAEQRNGNAVDRRFGYLQTNFSGIKNVQIFGSIEMDMYRKINDTIDNSLKLTSAYISLRYRPTKKLSLTASYDNRRNVIFYESNRLYIDQLLNQETRQGLRLMTQYQLNQKINVSLSVFYRYQASFAQPTKNYVANANINRLFGQPLMLNLNYNIINTNYFDGDIIGGRMNYDMMKGKMQLELNYRKVNYSFLSSEQKINQDIVGFGIQYQIRKLSTLMLNYELTNEPTQMYHRYFITAMHRFKSK